MRIAILHHSLMESQSGSSEKLLRDIASYLSSRSNIELTLIYGDSSDNLDEPAFNEENIFHQKFKYSSIGINSPCAIEDLSINFSSVLLERKVDIVIALAWSWSIRHLEEIPANIKLYLISPFGHVIERPNISKILVSGYKNFNKLNSLGYKNILNFLNPLNSEKYSDDSCLRKKSDVIVFGRVGRPDPYLFDPISLRAYKLLEDEFPGKVRFIYLNPCNQAIDFAYKNNIKSIEFRSWMNEEELIGFFHEFDILCHARHDGETLGIAIVEALLSGKCVVSHISQIHNEHLRWLKSPFGRFVGSGDVIAYYWAMRDFYIHKDSLGDYGMQAQNSVKDLFDSDRIYSSIYQDLLEICAHEGTYKLPLRAFLFHQLLKAFNLLKVVIRQSKFYEKIIIKNR